MQRVLLVGNVGSVFIVNLRNKLLESGVLVDVYDVWGLRLYKHDFGELKYFQAIDATNHHSFKSKLIRGLRLKMLHFFWSNKNNYDVVNFHFYIPIYSQIARIIRAKKVLTLWGTDVNGASAKTLTALKQSIHLFDKISCTNSMFAEVVRTKLHKPELQIEVVRFGLEPISNLEHLINDGFSRNEAKARFNFNLSKQTIVLGYQGTRNHQHLAMLHSIFQAFTSGALNPDDFEIIIPVAYGFAGEYKQELEAFIHNSGYSVVLFKQILDDLDMAKFRLSADIFVNLQVHDQLSGSMLESLYAGCYLITGDWLPYQILDDNQVFYKKIAAVAELANAIVEFGQNKASYLNSVMQNKEAIAKLVHWRECIIEWRNLYFL